jgi:hypothetical protein
VNACALSVRVDTLRIIVFSDQSDGAHRTRIEALQVAARRSVNRATERAIFFFFARSVRYLTDGRCGL